MLIEKIAIFVVFLGPLVFFHELGHFLFARLFGVRVEVFSLGFGPKILKKKWGDTEYALSIIPLGGYVKMYGDDPFNKDAVPESERQYSFTHKGKWARFWIVMGGPLANFILAFAIFFSLLMVGERIPEIKLGNVSKESILYQNGMRAGDVVLKINGSNVNNPSDLMVEGNKAVTQLTVRRQGEEVTFATNLPGDKFFDEFVKFPPIFKKPFLVDAHGKFYVVSLKEKEVQLEQSLEEISNLENVTQLYVYPVKENADLSDSKVEFDLESQKVLALTYTDMNSMMEAIHKEGFRTLDLMVKSVKMASPADKVGIRAGDIFVSIEGLTVYSFEQLRAKLQETKEENVPVEVYSKGELKSFTITPDVITEEGTVVKLMGVYSYLEVIKTNFITTQSKGFVNAIQSGLVRTWDSMTKTFDGFLKLITGQVSLKAIGGPLSIGKVAHDSYNTSISYFFQLMALISVNLGVINLFPIPVLDGGHIMFLGLELINGGPLSRRKMELAQQVGLSLLLLLMFGAIFNDVTRFF